MKNALGKTSLWGSLMYFRSPGSRETLGGPFNGCEKRIETIRALLAQLDFSYFVETGSYLGRTTEFLSTLTNKPIFTCELIPFNFGFARARLFTKPKVRLYNLDSRTFLSQILKKPEINHASIFFYLDSHWYDDLPLKEEIEIIFSTVSEALILIDDFEVPGDPGYQFDAYTPENTLNHAYLDQITTFKFSRFQPTAPAAEETGGKCGYVIITNSPAIESQLIQNFADKLKPA